MTTILLIIVFLCVATPNHERGRLIEWFLYQNPFWQNLIGSILAIFTLLLGALIFDKYL
jgi:hypothetical protein